MKAFLITLVILLIGIGAIGVVWWLIRRGSERLSGPRSAPVSPAVSPSPDPRRAEPDAPARGAARDAEVSPEPAAPAEPAPTPESARRATAVEEAVPNGPYGAGSATPLPDGSAPSPEFTIKGNGGSMLYHAPESPYFKRTKAEAWFRTAEDAEAAGFQHWNSRRRKK